MGANPASHGWGEELSEERHEQRPGSSQRPLVTLYVPGNMWPQTAFISCSLDRRALSLVSFICIMSKMSHIVLSFVEKYWQEVPIVVGVESLKGCKHGA